MWWWWFHAQDKSSPLQQVIDEATRQAEFTNDPIEICNRTLAQLYLKYREGSNGDN